MTRVAIHQPNYAPWVGYFAKMASVDVFVFLDDVQMPIGRSYVSRVKVLGRSGEQWLSVPVVRQAGEAIASVRFADDRWAAKHLATLRAHYARAPFFDEIHELVGPIYADPGERLAEFNIRLITAIARYLGVTARVERSGGLGVPGASTELLVGIVERVGGTVYVSGKGGENYQDPERFKQAGIVLDVRAYAPVPYDQGGAPFVAGLSILDALFRLGPATAGLLRYPSAHE